MHVRWFWLTCQQLYFETPFRLPIRVVAATGNLFSSVLINLPYLKPKFRNASSPTLQSSCLVAYPTMSFPVLDASRFSSSSAALRKQHAHELLMHLKQHGFVRLKNTGIPTQAIQDAFSLVSTSAFAAVRLPAYVRPGQTVLRASSGGKMQDHEPTGAQSPAWLE